MLVGAATTDVMIVTFPRRALCYLIDKYKNFSELNLPSGTILS
jgi:hypothetical protein